MENNTTNDQIGGSAEMEAAKAMFSDWKKSHEKTTKVKKVSREDALKKHFIPRDEKETFRPLHPNYGEKYVKVAFFHEILTNKAGGKKQKRKIYCPAHNDAQVAALDNEGKPVLNEQGQPVMIPVKCPICEESKRLLATQDRSILGKDKSEYTEEDKKIKDNNNEIYKAAKKIEAKKFFMVKGIDRGNEKHGPKFWRFKFNYKQQGVADKLIPLLSEWSAANEIHFANPENGIDVTINVVENTIPGSNYTYKDVSSISTSPRGSSQLHHDESIAKAWLADTTTWRDIYKPLEFSFMDAATVLDRLAKGTDTYWDDTNSNDKKWVFPDTRDINLAEKTNTRKANLDATPKNFEYASGAENKVSAAYNNVVANNQPKIADMTEESAGESTEDAVNITPQPKREIKQEPVLDAKETNVSKVTGNKDIEDLDLPF